MLLVTRRLALRRFHESDASTLAAYRSDPDVARYQSWDIPITVESATAFVRAAEQADPREPGWFQYAVELRATAYQGHGYAAQALRRVLRSARLLDRLGFRREGHRVANTWIKGEWTDDLLFGLLAKDWRPGAG
ncbi:MAG TPA: GNAT family protein [Pseudonocardiaceae bacterium]|jgi:aminoglycoside 6'-N-acetyltransferase